MSPCLFLKKYIPSALLFMCEFSESAVNPYNTEEKFREEELLNFVSKGKSKKCAKLSIMGDLAKFNIPEDVKMEADVVYKIITDELGVKKSKDILIYYCVFSAYSRIGTPTDPLLLGKKIGLSDKKIRRASREYALVLNQATGGKSQITYIEPHKLISMYAQDMCFGEEHIEELMLQYKRTISRTQDHDLLDLPDKTHAAGQIYYYIQTTGLGITLNTIASAFSLSPGTIKSAASTVCKVDNMSDSDPNSSS